MKSKGLSLIAIILLSFSTISLLSCRSLDKRTDSLSQYQFNGMTRLRVVLFPYIPDAGSDGFANLLQFLEKSFETRYPEIDLELRLNNEDEIYDIPSVRKLFSGDQVSEPYDLIEIDTVILGDLVANGLVSPWDRLPTKRNFFDVGIRAVTVNGVTYGVPHLLCGHYIFTRTPLKTGGRSIDGMVNHFVREFNRMPVVVGNLSGSWNMPSLYLDAWADTYSGSTALGLRSSLDPSTINNFRKIAELCEDEGENPCINGSYSGTNEIKAVEIFVKGMADGLVGYSERLHYILKGGMASEQVQMRSLPLGNGNSPVMFVDALVLRMGASDQITAAARAFADFLVSPEIQEYLVMSRDSKADRIPRYLIPATKDVFAKQSLVMDRFYRDLARDATIARPFPNTGFSSLRRQMRDEIKKAVEK
jgi:thiamine pyridinylase